MAITGVGVRIGDQVGVERPNRPAVRSTDQRAAERADSEAIKVELSPAARARAAASAVAAANQEAASSASYFASDQGQDMLGKLAGVAARGRLDVRL